jgi:hypothetical protein
MTQEQKKQQQGTQSGKNEQSRGGQPPAQSDRRDRQNHLGGHNQTTVRQEKQRSSGNA